MAFAQNMQCFVIDRYYRHINEKFPSKCEDALLTAFHLYMFQQGNRAAMRAVRDGNPLDFYNYEKYREVVSTPEMIKEDSPHITHNTLTHDQFEVTITRCTAHRLFGQLGTPYAAEKLFCKNVDTMNAKSFNPHLQYHVDKIMCDDEICIQKCDNINCPYTQLGPRAEDAPPFPYIMANMFQSMGKVIKAIFGAEGEEINNKVQQDFIDRYGNDDFDKIKVFFGSDFEIPYPYGLKKD
ncbi:MAG: L-2-amino-thiazoline-4-carboxylic acid hydrolase [Oscillospiraceae bacterium]|nr:L-2-amino-thiazoline-4-carboxylic acid hydrolase [Oscillospiraceae bacterium]MBQ6850201.1 L-2-amino-thiazoline-4-carboxylic acid hydrolase [Oscillospiraceae bacterium]